jgi:hypothetical protein
VKPTSASTSDFACTAQVDLPPVLAILGRLSLLRHFLGRHVDEEALGFAANMARKQITRSAALDRAAS